MDANLFNSFLKTIIINLGACYSFFKIINYDKRINWSKLLYILSSSIFLTCIECILKTYIPVFYSVVFIFICYSCIFKFLTKYKFSYSILITTISYSISYTFSLISTLVIALIFVDLYYPTEHYNIIHTLPIVFIAILNSALIWLFFKIKRFKNGFPFLVKYNDNESFNIFILIISAAIIFMYVFCAEIKTHTPLPILSIILLFFAIIMVLIIQKTFSLFQKQRLQTKALKDYEQEIDELKQKLNTALDEKQMLVKSNHEFYHRQEALNKKLDDLIKTSNVEFGNDYGEMLDRINNLSEEYSAKTNFIPKLAKTNITEIDDMLSYMQSECTKNNIEFNLQIDCSVNYMINNLISKSQLETLLGDLIRNAIIAINHSSDNYKSIMVVFGIKDDTYELCILDSGIPFEINTLINLGVAPASTHTNEGGTGIGFITTFETLASCNASFVINEITANKYTKSLKIKFDDKHEYIIISDRKKEISNLNTNNRDIILI